MCIKLIVFKLQIPQGQAKNDHEVEGHCQTLRHIIHYVKPGIFLMRQALIKSLVSLVQPPDELGDNTEQLEQNADESRQLLNMRGWRMTVLEAHLGCFVPDCTEQHHGSQAQAYGDCSQGKEH